MTRDELIDLGTEALIELRTAAWIAPEELMLARRDARAVIDALLKAGALAGLPEGGGDARSGLTG